MVLCLALLLAQTLPRPAPGFEFSLVEGGGKAQLGGYKGRVVALYLFSPD